MKFAFMLTVFNHDCKQKQRVGFITGNSKHLRANTNEDWLKTFMSMSCSSLPHYYCIRILLWLSDQQSARNQQLHYKRSFGKFLSQILLLTRITLPWSELRVRGKRLRWMLCFPPKLVITIITIKTFSPNLHPISPLAIQIQGGLEELIYPSLSFKIPTEAFSFGTQFYLTHTFHSAGS